MEQTMLDMPGTQSCEKCDKDTKGYYSFSSEKIVCYSCGNERSEDSVDKYKGEILSKIELDSKVIMDLKNKSLEPVTGEPFSLVQEEDIESFSFFFSAEQATKVISHRMDASDSLLCPYCIIYCVDLPTDDTCYGCPIYFDNRCGKGSRYEKLVGSLSSDHDTTISDEVMTDIQEYLLGLVDQKLNIKAKA